MYDPEIICIGGAHWDVIARANEPLPRGADVPGLIARRPGGVAANVAMGLARLGRRVGLISVLGVDAEGDQLQAALVASGVDCAFMCRSADLPTACYLAVEDAAGELVAAVADTAALEAPELIARLNAPTDWLPASAALFFEANLSGDALAALPLSRARLTAANAVSPAKAGRLGAFIGAHLGQIYLAKAEAEALGGAVFATALEAARTVRAAFGERTSAIVTDGPRAAASVGPSGEAAATPAEVIVKTVTGAGDALIATHLDAILRGEAPATALRTGLAAAAAHISGETP